MWPSFFPTGHCPGWESGTLLTVPLLLPPVSQEPFHGGSEWDQRVPQASRGWHPGCGLSSDEIVSTERFPALQISSHRSITAPWLHFADGNTEAQKGKNTCKDYTAIKCQCLNQTQVFRSQTQRALLVTDSHSELPTPHCETHGARGACTAPPRWCLGCASFLCRHVLICAHVCAGEAMGTSMNGHVCLALIHNRVSECVHNHKMCACFGLTACVGNISHQSLGLVALGAH